MAWLMHVFPRGSLANPLESSDSITMCDGTNSILYLNTLM